MGGLVARSACHYGKNAKSKVAKHPSKKLFSWEHHIMGHHWSKREIGLIICWKPTLSVSPFHVLVKSGVPELRTSDTAIFLMMTGISGTGLIRLATVEFLCHYRRELIATQLLQQSLANHRRVGDDLIGDGLVPLYSALGRHANAKFALQFPSDHQWIGRNLKAPGFVESSGCLS
jgi:hypothetical protein